jgi:hypothetical protein
MELIDDRTLSWPKTREEYENPDIMPPWSKQNVRSAERLAADDWAREMDWYRYTVMPNFTMGQDHPSYADFCEARVRLAEEVHAIVIGGSAPTEQHARAAALQHLDWTQQFMMNRRPERSAYLAALVLDGYATAHPDV